MGRNHSLEEALAELVDNSIDANATHVTLRFVRMGVRVYQVEIVDDGDGMSAKSIDTAMTVGGEREYGSGEIGRFGAGLKASSASQAGALTVFSRGRARESVARRVRFDHPNKGFKCDVIDDEFARETLDAEWNLDVASTGTIVRWDDVHGFPASASAAESDRFLQGSINKVGTHLGIVYHRLLDRGDLTVTIEVREVGGTVQASIPVSAVDPFAYPRSGASGWPKKLRIESQDHTVKLHCHVWPGRSTLDEFRLDGNAIARQGLYVYYNDRLIQTGGWNGLEHADKQLNVARASIDVRGDIPEFLSIRPEKTGITIGPRFVQLVRDAKSKDGSTFADYLEAARTTTKESNRRKRERTPRIPAGSGFDPDVRKVIAKELPMKNEDAIEIRWCPLEDDEFFNVDRESSIIWLNKKYRHALLGGRAGGLNDLPVLKTLLYLLLEEVFSGQNLGPRDRDNLELWQSLLTTAALAECP